MRAPLSTPGQAATWLETERANLHAATAHAAASGQLQHAMLIPAAMHDFLYAEGHWDQQLALDQIALAAARQGDDRPGQARALLLLSDPQFYTHDRAAAVAATQQALALYRDLGNQVGQASALNGLGFMYRVSSDYRSAACCQQALELFRGLATGGARLTPLSTWEWCSKRPGTAGLPSPACNRRWSCRATPPT